MTTDSFLPSLLRFFSLSLPLCAFLSVRLRCCFSPPSPVVSRLSDFPLPASSVPSPSDDEEVPTVQTQQLEQQRRAIAKQRGEIALQELRQDKVSQEQKVQHRVRSGRWKGTESLINS